MLVRRVRRPISAGSPLPQAGPQYEIGSRLQRGTTRLDCCPTSGSGGGGKCGGVSEEIETAGALTGLSLDRVEHCNESETVLLVVLWSACRVHRSEVGDAVADAQSRESRADAQSRQLDLEERGRHGEAVVCDVVAEEKEHGQWKHHGAEDEEEQLQPTYEWQRHVGRRSAGCGGRRVVARRGAPIEKWRGRACCLQKDTRRCMSSPLAPWDSPCSATSGRTGAAGAAQRA
eukprot:5550496-Prymnesium_polylepis.1